MNEESIRQGIGSFEARIISELASEGRTIFSIEELARKTGSRDKARNIASRLAKKRWLDRLGRGVYLILELGAGSKPEWTADSYYIASKIVSPYYIGYYNMLNEYGWTEQIPLTINIATTKKITDREIHGVRYKFITLSKKKFFGASKKLVGGHEVWVSDPEKTLADALDHPEYCGGIAEVAKSLYNAHDQVDWHKFVKYAKRMGNSAIYKRFGYLVELMEISVAKGVLGVAKRMVGAGYSPLYPSIPLRGKHDSRWNLIINAAISKKSVLA